MAMAAQPHEVIAQQRGKVGQCTGAGSAQCFQHKDHARIHKAGQRKNDAKGKIFAQHDAAHRHRACEQQLVGATVAFLGKGAHGEHRNVEQQHKNGAVQRVVAKIRQAVAQIQRHKIDSRSRQHKGGKHRTNHAVKAAAEFSFKDGKHLSSPPLLPGLPAPAFFRSAQGIPPQDCGSRRQAPARCTRPRSVPGTRRRGGRRRPRSRR